MRADRQPRPARLPRFRAPLFALASWLCCLLLSLAANAQPAPPAAVDPWAVYESVWFDTVSVADGLPHSTTTAIVQDTRGLIWIGTFGGLVRYDGYRMQVFGQEPDSYAGAVLPDSYVRALAPLEDGGLLIGTNAGGLVRFDPSTMRFHVYPIGPGGTSDGKIFAIAPAREHGVYWIATEGGVDRLDLASGKITHVAPVAGDAKDMKTRTFVVAEDKAGRLWAGADNGLFVRRPGSHFTRVQSSDPEVDEILHDQVWALLEDSRGRLWIGTGQSGAIYIGPKGQGHLVPGFSGKNGMARRRTVRAFHETPQGVLWAATDGAGVVTYDFGSGRLRSLAHDAAMPSSLPGDITRDIFQDTAGNIWVATELGAAHYDPHGRKVFSVLPSPLETHTLSNANVHGIFVDPRGRVWLGLGMGRIDVLDLAKGSMRHLQLGGEQAERDVQAFVVAPDGSIWAGAQGISRIDPDTFALESSVIPSLDGRLILSMQRDGDDILIGGYDGLFRYDTVRRTLTQMRHDEADPHSLVGDQVRYIVRMPGAWWFATISGISIAYDGEPGFVNLRHDPADPTSLPQDYTGSMAFDSRGRLWLGTFGGIAYLDEFKPRGPFHFGLVGAREGLSNTKINALLVDHDDRVWASMANGVAMVDTATHRVANLGIRDGLRIPSYIHRAAAEAPGGELMFGGLGGLTVVRPYWVAPVAAPPRLAVTQVSVNERILPLREIPGDGGEVSLGAGARNLRVDFALLDFRAPMETHYAYRMDGTDAGWNEVQRGIPPSAIYTNLPSGTYTLRLRATMRGLDARTVETSIRVVVTPRWYESPWTLLAGIALGVALFFGLVYLRTLYLRRRAELLQVQVDARTRDLKAANERLDHLAGTDELTGSLNRRRFLEQAERVRQGAAADGIPFSVVLIDIDDFKVVNDTYGHLAGDTVIRETMRVISSMCRADDLAGRFGGEEFILCLPGALAEHALDMTERVRHALGAMVIVHGDYRIRITVSAGVAMWRAPESLNSLLGRADDALYEAKNAGRNRSRIAAL
ncbi:ligand-binding sensor domain-containing diguanylate cyclase [Luteibacter sp. SG786]|uniref:ligand-binding sensor domain-containing protein n=1 Tax=Luteibacter sp. SG786 TaxID=2587130 RepID=UPI0014248847|nr:ligand-binding sensor domain-containing diguanylate cyclase [Luteibacter sp. SG786]NII54869.1 diguanylate cyclase (GGDEF)-like protein [Luteibacter sp. SG786]